MLPLHRLTITAAVVASLAVPAAASAMTSAVSPDARDAGLPTAAAPALMSHDLVTPDARDAAPAGPTDLRSPDVRFGQPDGSVAPPSVRTVEVPQSGFQWGDAGIGAGAVLSLLMLGVGVVLLTTHGRRERRIRFLAH
jgi:hypothetical protein